MLDTGLIPRHLKVLDISFNKISRIHSLPPYLRIFRIQNNLLTYIDLDRLFHSNYITEINLKGNPLPVVFTENKRIAKALIVSRHTKVFTDYKDFNKYNKMLASILIPKFKERGLVNIIAAFLG
jgi:hypothetical protein